MPVLLSFIVAFTGFHAAYGAGYDADCLFIHLIS